MVFLAPSFIQSDHEPLLPNQKKLLLIAKKMFYIQSTVETRLNQKIQLKRNQNLRQMLMRMSVKRGKRSRQAMKSRSILSCDNLECYYLTLNFICNIAPPSLHSSHLDLCPSMRRPSRRLLSSHKISKDFSIPFVLFS